MPDPSHQRVFVLHIGPADNEPGNVAPGAETWQGALSARTRSPFPALANLAETLTRHEIRVEHCGDVYRGLAQLCQAADRPARVALVSVDTLADQEFEFFSIASHLRPRAETFVYGVDSARTSQAVEQGAEAVLTEETAALVAERLLQADQATRVPQVPSSPEDQAPVPAPPEPSTERSASTPPDRPSARQAPPHAERQDAQEAQEAPDSDEADRGPARVPWLRYGDRPQRTPPSRRPPDPPPDADEGANDHQDSLDEPLLTEAELQALIGDDISAIAPNDRGPSAETNPERDHDDW